MVALTKVRSGALQALRAAVLDRTPVSIGPRRTASPHEYYRYPARFAPSVAAATIDAFTKVGDTVADYFVGGGTTMVEARLASRYSIGADINSLATFVTRVKTRTYSAMELEHVVNWADALSEPCVAVSWPTDRELPSYFRNFDGQDFESHRAVIISAFSGLQAVPAGRARDLARCVLLRTAQWALDMRGEIPTAEHLTEALRTSTAQMTAAARSATTRYRAADRRVQSDGRNRALVVDQGVPGLAAHTSLGKYPSPDLVLTSPPYPGVYVNYHRWKLRGRLETPLPYFIAGQEDGHGLAHYTMSARSDRTQNTYFERLQAGFADIAAMCKPSTWVVQVVGFNNLDDQLPRFLAAMTKAGFGEYLFEQLSTDEDGRLWRDVPGRRWWARAGDRLDVATHTAREVVLIHKLSQHR